MLHGAANVKAEVVHELDAIRKALAQVPKFKTQVAAGASISEVWSPVCFYPWKSVGSTHKDLAALGATCIH